MNYQLLIGEGKIFVTKYKVEDQSNDLQKLLKKGLSLGPDIRWYVQDEYLTRIEPRSYILMASIENPMTNSYDYFVALQDKVVEGLLDETKKLDEKDAPWYIIGPDGETDLRYLSKIHKDRLSVSVFTLPNIRTNGALKREE